MTSRTCSNCRFWVQLGSTETGECRAHPPVAIAHRDERVDGSTFWDTATVFPDTVATSWCGEYSQSLGEPGPIT